MAKKSSVEKNNRRRRMVGLRRSVTVTSDGAGTKATQGARRLSATPERFQCDAVFHRSTSTVTASIGQKSRLRVQLALIMSFVHSVRMAGVTLRFIKIRYVGRVA